MKFIFLMLLLSYKISLISTFIFRLFNSNISSSFYTLKTMAYISVFIPFVIAYIAYVWKNMDKTKMSKKELEKSDVVY